MSQNPYPYGYIRWARFHLDDAPGGCSTPKDCADCAVAKGLVAAAEKADQDVAERERDILTGAIKDAPENQPAPKKRL